MACLLCPCDDADSLMARSPRPRAVTPTVLQHVRSRQSVYFVWELTWAQEPPPSLRGRFSVGFCPASEERLAVSLKPYTYDFHLENFFVRIVSALVGVWLGKWEAASSSL